MRQPQQDNSSSPLVSALKTYDRYARRRFHVPAHAGQSLFTGEAALIWQDPFRYDLTELDGLDVLSEPSGPIAESQQAIAEQFGVNYSFMLVNGASVGLTAAMLALVQPGDKVLVARNAHRAVLSGLILAGAQPVWFLPESLPEWGLWGAVSPECLAEQLRLHPDVKAVFLTSPTYEGIGSPIQDLAALCKAHSVALVVDEAHGSLWPLSGRLPRSACRSGADVVIHSLHKSGGSLTQSALVHLPHGSKVDPMMFQQALNTLQTTSPSYLLMGSLDSACAFWRTEAGQQFLETHLDRVDGLRARLKQCLTHIQLFEGRFGQWDQSKLYFRHPVESGEDWGARLEAEAGLAYESASLFGVLYLANVGLADEDFHALETALLQEDQRVSHLSNADFPEPYANPKESSDCFALPQMGLTPREAFFAPGELLHPDQALGRIAKQTVVHCPPGIPVLMPGEQIQAAHIPLLPKEGILVVR